MRKALVKRYPYGERDYAFGQLMLTLRTAIGLPQAGMAERLGVSQRAVAGWETGSSYPKAERLKQLIELGMEPRPLPPGTRKRRFVRSGVQRTRRCCWMSAGFRTCSLRLGPSSVSHRPSRSLPPRERSPPPSRASTGWERSM